MRQVVARKRLFRWCRPTRHFIKVSYRENGFQCVVQYALAKCRVHLTIEKKKKKKKAYLPLDWTDLVFEDDCLGIHSRPMSKPYLNPLLHFEPYRSGQFIIRLPRFRPTFNGSQLAKMKKSRPIPHMPLPQNL